MDDTISRLAVIQIIEKMRARIGHNLERSVGRAMIEILDEVGKDVEKLPSAQPTFDARDTQYNLPIGTDCISRQAALDALNHELRCGAVINQCGLEAAYEVIEDLPSAQPKRGKWILDRSGAYCCSECMEPCAGYVMMKPRDKFCKMCGAKMEVTT